MNDTFLIKTNEKPFFPIKREKLRYHPSDYANQIAYSGHDALINQDTGALLGVVSKQYKVIPHQTIADRMEEIVDKLTDAKVERQIRTNPSGSKLYYRMHLTGLAFDPATGTKIPPTALDGSGHQSIDRYYPILTGHNSYDGTTLASYDYGAFRSFCSNLCGTMQSPRQIQIKHRGPVEWKLERARIHLQADLDLLIKKVTNTYARLNTEPATTYMKLLLATTFANKYVKIMLNELKTAGADQTAWEEEKGQVKPDSITLDDKTTAFAVWNILTAIATHRIQKIQAQEKAHRQIANIFFAGRAAA